MLSNSLIFFVVIGILTTFSFVHSRETPQEFLSADFHSFTHLKKLDTNKLGEDLHRKQTILSASRLRQDTVFAELYKDGSRLSEEFYKILLQNVTVDCADQFKHYLEAFSALPKIPDTWVLQMLDSWGKLPSGILSGNTAAGMLGDFHECVQLKGKYESKDNTGEVNVKGKYCHTVLLPGPALMDLKGGNNTESVLATLDLDLKNSASWEELIIHFLSNRWPQVVPMMGTCFPAACSSDDAQQILTSFHTHVLKNLVTQVVANCQTDEKPPLDAGRCAMIVILSLIALVCITGTFIDVYGTEAVKLRPGMNVILAFSFYTNTKRWLNMRVGTDNLGCFHGIKFFSMLWILQGHTFVLATAVLVWNNWDLQSIHEDWSVYPIINGFTSVDTFFVLSGTLVCYNLMKELDKQEGRFNYILFVVHRYLRITPTLMILIGTYATLVTYVASGPLWYFVAEDASKCRKYWWENMLYINNLMEYGNGKCYNIGWYLANEMQFFVLSPLVIYPLWRWKRVGYGIIAVLGVAAVVSPAVITAHYNIPPTEIKTIDPALLTMSLWADTYSTPWCRFGAYLVGIVVGYLLYLGKVNPKLFKGLPKAVVIIGWTLSTVFTLAIIYGAMFYFDPKNTYETLHSAHAAIYGGFHRVVWSICIGWVIFACVNGYGGWANKILSLKIFIPLGRLTFCMYLVQLQTVFTYFVMGTHSKRFSKYTTVNELFGLTIITGLISYVVSMALESPFMQLEKIIFSSRSKPPKVVKEGATE